MGNAVRIGFLMIAVWFANPALAQRPLPQVLPQHTESAAPMLGADSLITNAIGRGGRSLSGLWAIIVDPSSIGDRSAVSPALPGQSFFNDKQNPPPMDLVEYRFSDEVTLSVPGDWNSQAERLFFYQGPVWYRRKFDAPTTQGRHFLHFGAANHTATVYLNGKMLARHEGGFTPFDVEVTDALRPGPNSLVVKVDNTATPTTVPADKTDWLNRGGLTRDVLLLSVPRAFVRQYDLALVDREKRLIRVRVQADGAQAGQKVKVSLPALRRSVALTLSADGRSEALFSASVSLWEPGSPKLYDVELTLGDDRVRDRIGFRTIETRGSDILLNGKPIFLKGISSQEESPLHLGRARGREDADAIIGLAQELGANFIRLGQYPNDEHMARVADERGLLVWEEIPVFWTMAWRNPATLDSAKAQLAEVVTRDRNRASVVLWSIGNETPMSDERLTFMRALAAEARRLDQTRLITSALLGDPRKTLGNYVQLLAARLLKKPDTPADQRAKVAAFLKATLGHDPTAADLERLSQATEIVVDDPIGNDVDVLAYNEYFGWYYPPAIAAVLGIDETTARRLELEVMPELKIGTAFDKPFVITEFGADATPGFVGNEETLFSEAYQARLFQQQLKMLANSPRLRGISPWVLRDFQTPLRPHPEYQRYWNRKGLVAANGSRKMAFDVVRAFYARSGTLESPFKP